MLIHQIYQEGLQPYRDRIDEKLAEVAASQEHPHIREMVSYALEGGRRFRPLLFILVGKLLGREPDERVYSLAAAMEILHKASLLHDDLVDGDRFRRGRQTFHEKYGPEQAVVVGDLLVAEASIQFYRNADPALIGSWLEQYRRLCLGETMDVIGFCGARAAGGGLAKLVDDIIYGKTASFMEFVFSAAAYTGGASEEQRVLLAGFGRHLGFVFQIINDLNNWSGLEAGAGRTEGTDLSQGKANHVTVLARAGRHDRAEVERLVREIVEAHDASAREALRRLGIRNQYTLILNRILDGKYNEWYWGSENS